MSDTIFQSFFDAQQKVMEYWTEAFRKMTEKVHAGKEGQRQDPATSWWEWQKRFLNSSPALSMPAGMEEASDQFRIWMALQNEMNMKLWEAYVQAVRDLGKSWPDKDLLKPLRFGADFLNQWTHKSDQLFQEKNWKDMPENLGKYLNVYGDLFNLFYKYWEPLSKLIEHGIYDQEIIEKYYSQKAYQGLMKKVLDITPDDKWIDLLEKGNELFEYYIEYFNDFAPTLENTMIVWDRFLEQFTPSGINPLYKVLMDINRNIREVVDPFYVLAGPKKELQFAQLIRESHFNYISFLIKTAELQGMVIEASHLVLPETLKEMNEKFSESGETPELNLFFKAFLDKLEELMIDVLKSEKYSKLQNEVAKAGVDARSKLDQLFELSLQGLPVVTKTEEDDIAHEMHALREKVMQLERELKKVKGKKGKMEAVNGH